MTQSIVVGEIRLQRDSLRLLGLPVLVIAGGAAGAASAVLISGPLGIAVAAAGLLVAIGGIYLAAWHMSFRLIVEAGGLEIRWLGGRRRYRLVRGQLTRVVLRGEGAAALRPRLGVLGMGLGPALLRGEEHIQLLRLASPDSMILVPTDHGRLALTAIVEQELLEALTAAVRRQQEIAAAAARTAAMAPAPAAVAADREPAAGAGPSRMLTGIERALLEERLAAERAAARAAAEAERQEAAKAGAAPSLPARGAGVTAVAADETSVSAARRRTRTQWQRPGWLALPPVLARSPRVLAAIPVFVPLLVAGAAWVVADAAGRLTGPSPEARYLLMALALSGPLAALAVFVTRTWQPRLAGLVSWSAIAAQILVVRALIV